MVERLPRVIVAAVILFVLLICAIVQAASMAFVREPHTLSAIVPRTFGLAVYRALDRVTHASFVEETLAEDALVRGDLESAQHYAVRVAAGGRRDDLLGRIAEARGETVLAREYYFAAPDIDRMQAAIATLAKTDPRAAFELEVRFGERLASLQTHPDALAQSENLAGLYAAKSGDANASLVAYERAAALAPFDTRYAMSAGDQALIGLHDDVTAKRYYDRALADDPACADCLAGLGFIAFHRGDRAQAQAYAARARAIDPHSPLLIWLEQYLK
jgi:tetratricopeptide (TPR) repeat protein